MNKFEFIKELLETKKFNSNQKERFIKLVSSEFVSLEARDSEVLEDIRLIKEKIGLGDINNKPNNSSSRKANFEKSPSDKASSKAFTIEQPSKASSPFENSRVLSNEEAEKVLRSAMQNKTTLSTEEGIKALGSAMQNKTTLSTEDGIKALESAMQNKTTLSTEEGIKALKFEVNEKEKKHIREIAQSHTPEYLESYISSVTNPGETNLTEKIDLLSNVYDGTKKEKQPLIELIQMKYKDINSESAVKAINRIYYLIRQKQVMNGEFEKLGISRDDFIIPDTISIDILNKKKTTESITNVENLEKLPSYYFPSSLYKFLFNYNQNKILRSTCHDVGSQELIIINNYCNTEIYDFKKHLEKIKEAYDSHENKYFAPSFLKTRFRVYLTGKNYYGQSSKGWSEESIKVNWSSFTLKEWSEKNPGIPPNLNDALVESIENIGFENFENFTSNISGVSVQSFTQLVYHFKHSFHLNGDNPLRVIIERTNNLNNWNEHIDFIIENDSFPSNIEHFTDVDKLVQAYKSIIELIIEVVNKHELERPKVKITAKVSLEEFQLSVHHLNSIYKRDIIKTLERPGQHYSNLIENQVNGLCNLILKAEFETDPKSQINIWDGKERNAIQINDKNFKGVEHIFQFPKK